MRQDGHARSRVWKHEGANDSAVDNCMKRPLLIALQSASY